MFSSHFADQSELSIRLVLNAETKNKKKKEKDSKREKEKGGWFSPHVRKDGEDKPVQQASL